MYREVLAYLFLFCVAQTECACPLNTQGVCSAHGKCKINTCECFSGWNHVADCSQRTCPYGKAWFDKAKSEDQAHAPAECSNAGICDRVTGECKCFSGHEGNACQRTSCHCNDRGYCKSIGQISLSEYGKTYPYWDKDVTQVCYCDAGYSGYDCSEQMCPKGDDYRTKNQTDVKVDIEVSGVLSGTFTLRFEGYENTFRANPAEVSDCSEILSKLENIEEATCVKTLTSSGAIYSFTIMSFPIYPKQNNVHHHNGQDIMLSSFICKTERSPNSLCNVTIKSSGNGVKEYATCSNSGTCDRNTGVCNCFEGFTGAACEQLVDIISTTESESVLDLKSRALGYTGTVLDLTAAKASATDFNFVKASASDSELFSLRGDGLMSLKGGLSVQGGAACAAKPGRSPIRRAIPSRRGARGGLHQYHPARRTGSLTPDPDRRCGQTANALYADATRDRRRGRCAEDPNHRAAQLQRGICESVLHHRPAFAQGSGDHGQSVRIACRLRQ